MQRPLCHCISPEHDEERIKKKEGYSRFLTLSADGSERYFCRLARGFLPRRAEQLLPARL